MGSAEVVDPYLDPETGLLRNLIGARTSGDLTTAETDLCFVRATQLLDAPVARSNNLAELQAIHFQLFQDVYDWAGQPRVVDIKKNTPDAEFFLPWQHIATAAETSFAALAEDHHLKDLGRNDFVQRLAVHYEKINYVHPFREGNGRTQRVFWNHVAREAGWQLDWRSVHGPENHEAARAGSDDNNLEPLIAMFDKIVTRPVADSSEESWRTQEIHRLSIRTYE